ncbi:ATP-binding protein [Qipengyuania pelagi]|mgnify:FL=1|uniref:histidine kinase n=1 Tax=Qipengyuania pelagi TaxID=994320 RepID=A0A844Y522_9SPHN|nr:ATP-binding protein [Qipengyuania pelagi]MXO53224.1 two-component sensor histidine kinase [Qipengyuania pelagi]
MGDRSNFPWPAAALALAAGIVMLVSGAGIALAFAVTLLWIATLWMVGGPKPPPSADVERQSMSAERMGELFEFSDTPIIVTRRNRVAVANRAARKLLGPHIVEQDVRMALRQPEAVALIDRDTDGFAVIRGLARRQDIWRINRKTLDDGMAVIEFVNRTAEADTARAHTDFVANASHELRTPLASILGYVETLQDDADNLDSAMAKRFLGTIEREGRRLQDLVSDLMSLSRIEAEKDDLPSNTISLAPLVRRAASDAAGQDRATRLDIEADGEFLVSGDTQQLEQLVRNLVDNALKYGGEESSVSVSLQPQGTKRVRLTVADRGEGIAPEHIPHLTRRFYRTDPGRSRASGGTGLGLAIVKHIVERHRGRLDIESTLGEGTRVAVLLPIQDDSRDDAGEAD